MREPDPDALLARMPARLLAEWEAYYELEPFGQPHQDLGFGYIASAVYNAQRGKGDPLTPGSFYPHLRSKRETTRITAGQLKDQIKNWLAALGGRPLIKEPRG